MVNCRPMHTICTKSKWTIFYIFILSLNLTLLIGKTKAEEVDLNLLNLLNDIDKSDETDNLDIRDMFGESKNDVPNIYIEEEDPLDVVDSSDCAWENRALTSLKSKLQLSLQEIKDLEGKLKTEKLLTLNLQHKIVKDNVIDAKPFFVRLVHHFWTNLIGKKNILEDFPSKESFLLRYLQVKIRPADIALFEMFAESKDETYAYDKIDLFFQQNLLEYQLENKDAIHYQHLRSSVLALVNHFSSTETWVKLLWGVFICLGIWCFWLFVKDIQHEFRWLRIITMMTVILFGISCIFHYWYLVKLKDSKRQNFIIQHEGRNIPMECQQKGSRSWFPNVFSWFGSQDSTCDKYFEYLMTDASDGISPMVVVTETIAIFLLSPMEHVGTHVGKFFAHFYANVPWLFLIPATVIMVSLIVILILSSFGYGIYFPFWFGSIRPASDKEASVAHLKKIVKESETKMMENNQKMVEEARQMLLQISEATRGRRNGEQHGVYPPVVEISTEILEKKLEQIISKRFDQIESPSPCSTPSTQSRNCSPFRNSSPARDHVRRLDYYQHQPSPLSSRNNSPYRRRGDRVDSVTANHQQEFVSQVQEALNQSISSLNGSSYLNS